MVCCRVVLVCVLWPLLPVTGLLITVDPLHGSTQPNCWDIHNHTCKHLDDALAGAQQLLPSRQPLTVHLFSGTHHLGPNTSLSVFHEAQNLTISGVQDTSVTVNCNNSNGFVFTSSEHVRFEYLTLEHCVTQKGMPAELQTKNPHTNTALAWYNCQSVTMRGVVVKDNSGIGVLMYNTLGSNVIANSSFVNNQLHDKTHHRAAGQAFGGMVIMFFYCLDGTILKDCIYYITPSEHDHISYVIENSWFMNNNATHGEFVEPRLTVSLDHFRELVSKGGGLSILMHAYASHTNIQVTNCTFINNSASWGAGAHLCFRDYSRNNVVYFTKCTFDSNFSPVRSQPGGSHGGGADVVYLQKQENDVYNNTVNYHHCLFENNKALYGGGVSVQVSEVQATRNNVTFLHSVFEGNVANVGAAADLSVSFLLASFGENTGRTLALFKHCTFSSNKVIPGTAALNQTPRIGNGAVYIYRIQAMFEGINKFTSNIGTGLVLATWATLINHSSLYFADNIGSFGGAMRFTGSPRLDVLYNTSVQFISNRAQYLGGAIYASYTDVHSEIYVRSCFIRYLDHTISPNYWNSSFLFVNNTAGMNGKENSIWVSSLIPCYWLDNSTTNINTTFCWDKWHYDGSTCHAQVSSSGTNLVAESPRNINFYPGIDQKVPLTLQDDLGHDVSEESVLAASIIQGLAEVVDGSFLRADSNITILGAPNTTIQLNLQTRGPSGFIRECNIFLLPCPPGFVPQPYDIEYSKLPPNATPKCVCGGNYQSLVQCDSDDVSATILDGFAMSYDPTHQQTVVGPIPYPIFSSEAGRRPLPQLVSDLDDSMCGQLNRTGMLCSQCQPGLSVKMGFSTLECVNCTLGPVASWFIFFGEQLFPTTLFFLFVVLGNINAASASLNAFIFYSQVMTNPLSFRLVSPWVHSIGDPSFVNAFTSAEQVVFIPYSIWNLDFKVFQLVHNHVCFITGNNILAHISLEYINALYPLMLIGVSYVLVTLHGLHFRPVVYLWKPFRVCFLRFKRTWNPKLSIINAFATFVIVSYVEFLATSVKLLANLQLYGSDKVLDSRYFFDASKRYFGPEHFPYAVLAIVVLSVVILPPPILMFLYPLKRVQSTMGRCRPCSWHGLRMFVEAIQGAFEDGTNGTRDRRFFAGLYFVFRIALILILGVTTTFLLQYLLIIAVILIIILLFVLLEPYKDPFYNKLDTAMFVNILAVHVTNFFNVYVNTVFGMPSVALWAVSQLLLAVPLLCLLFVKLPLTVWRKTKRYIERRKQRSEERILEEEEWSVVSSEVPRKRKRSLVNSGRPRLVTISEVTLSDELPDRLLRPSAYMYEPLEKQVDTQDPQLQNTYGTLGDGVEILDSQEMKELNKH